MSGPVGRAAPSAWLGLVLVLAASACTTKVVRVPVDPAMDEPDQPPAVTVKDTSVGVVRPVIRNSAGLRVSITSAFSESYPTHSHLAHAVPQALQEAGFRVVEVRDEEEARALGLDWVVALGTPEVDAVHPAQGDRVTLVGSGFDVRVHYRAVVRSAKDSKLLGLVTGFGQRTNRFIFMEPLFREAVVGVFVSLATMAASIFGLALIFQLGLLGNLAGRGDVLGLCYEGRDSATGARTEGALLRRIRSGPDLRNPAWVDQQQTFTTQGMCVEAVNYGLYAAFGVAVSMFTSILGGVAGAVGGNFIDVVLAALHLARVDPVWRGMVQDAHDEAARELAQDLAERVHLVARAPPQARQFQPPPEPGQLPALQHVPRERPAVAPEQR